MSGFSLKWSVDLAHELQGIRDYRRGGLEVFAVIIGMVICNLVAGPSIALIGFAHAEPAIPATLALGLIGGAGLSAATGILWRKANLMSGNLSINVVSYLTPLLSLAWLFALSLVGKVDVALLLFGAVLIVTANIGVYVIARHDAQIRASVLRPIESRRIKDLIAGGESEHLEFKSALRMNLNTQTTDRRVELGALKTLAAFMNSGGGTLVVGVSDDGRPVGVQVDGFASEDRMGLHLRNIAITRMGPAAMSCVHARFESYGGVRVMAVRCDPSPVPVYLRGPDESVEFYIRAGPSSSSLSVRDSHEYIVTRF